jgi:hypothetical protein
MSEPSQRFIDRIVAMAYGGPKVRFTMKQLAGDELGADDTSFFPIDPSYLVESVLNDSKLGEITERDGPYTEKQRRAYVISELRKILQGDHSEDVISSLPAACLYPLVDSRGRRATVAWEISGFSFEGAGVGVVGVFRNRRAVRVTLPHCEYG